LLELSPWEDKSNATRIMETIHNAVGRELIKMQSMC
jgi:hypothetical protein